MSALRASVVCFIEGIGGIQHQTQGIDVKEDDISILRSASTCWYSAVTSAMNEALSPEKRKDNFASSPAVWCAVGAIGHDRLVKLIGEDLSKRKSEQELKSAFRETASRLISDVNWNRDDHWTKFGAKKSVSGVRTLGGPKEVGSLIYKALRDRALVTHPAAA